MNSSESTTKLSALETNVEFIALSAMKLDKYFSNPTAAQKYLTYTGWLNEDGMELFQKRWNAYSICAVLLKRCTQEVEKTPEVVEAINEKLVGSGCTFSLRPGNSGQYFGLKAHNFFWFGGLPLKT